ncbi:MAG: hypothetical protein Faunusvirus36_3 [Faunusvirus sp.]|jgi:ankyrin repeat protein|uniref:Uncharacterized protein n=1 Tax=Faunusvirus sp. TaxID=2487766 RepID=A0A3G4ZXP4_9VIRU|nr:MAG: hypothetical protein Faunusvirus36_3 [Faunusvirus sp.]
MSSACTIYSKPLDVAKFRNMLSYINMLISSDDDQNLINDINYSLNQCKTMIIESDSYNVEDGYDEPLLSLLLRRHKYNLLKLFITHIKNINYGICSYEGNNFLHALSLHTVYAVPQSTIADIAKLILKNNIDKAIINKKNNNNETPLYFACAIANWPIADVLIDYNADIIVYTKNYRTCLNFIIDAKQTALTTKIRNKYNKLIADILDNKECVINSRNRISDDIVGVVCDYII